MKTTDFPLEIGTRNGTRTFSYRCSLEKQAKFASEIRNKAPKFKEFPTQPSRVK